MNFEYPEMSMRPNPLAHCPGFLACSVEPVLPAIAIQIARFLTNSRIPQRRFETECLAKHRTRCLEAPVGWKGLHRPAGVKLLMGIDPVGPVFIEPFGSSFRVSPVGPWAKPADIPGKDVQ